MALDKKRLLVMAERWPVMIARSASASRRYYSLTLDNDKLHWCWLSADKQRDQLMLVLANKRPSTLAER